MFFRGIEPICRLLSNLLLTVPYSLLLKGGEVSACGLHARVRNAYRLAFVKDEGFCLAIGALKIPNADYKRRVFTKSGVSELASEYVYELGFLYTKPTARGKGIAAGLVGYLTQAADKSGSYATTRENNAVMQHLLVKAGFVRRGNVYTSNRGDYFIGLYVRK